MSQQDPTPRARAVPRRSVLDRTVFALATGLAALLTIIALAVASGFESTTATQLGFTASPDESSERPSGNGSEEIADDSTSESSSDDELVVELTPPPDAWFRSDPDSATRFETERAFTIGEEALTLIDYDWQQRLPEWRIDFVEGDTRIAGYTWSHERRIEVFIRDDATPAGVARILAHELGHAVDVTYNSSDERLAWLEQRNAEPDTPWWPSSGAADFETGAGDFAESFAVWLVGPDDYRSRVAPAPTQTDLALLERLATEEA